MPGSGGLPVPGQRDIHGILDQHAAVPVGLQLGLPVGEGLPDGRARRADALARLSPGGRGSAPISALASVMGARSPACASRAAFS